MGEEPEELQTVIGRNARRLRESRGLSLDDIASRGRILGMTWRPSSIADLENGKRSATLQTLLVLAGVLTTYARCEDERVSLADLVSGDGDVWINRSLAFEAREIAGYLEGAVVDFEGGADAPEASGERRGLGRGVGAFVPGRPQLPAGPDPTAAEVAQVQVAYRLADERAAKRLRVDDSTAQAVMARALGASLSDRSASKAAEESVGEPSSQRKGAVTRALTELLRADLILTNLLPLLGDDRVRESRTLDKLGWQSLALALYARIYGGGEFTDAPDGEGWAVAPSALDGLTRGPTKPKWVQPAPWATRELIEELYGRWEGLLKGSGHGDGQ